MRIGVAKIPRSLRFVIVFGACFVVGFALLATPPLHAADERFSRILVRISGWLVMLCGGHASVEDDVLRSAGGFGVAMKDGCNGINVMILLWSAMLAFPASWSSRGLGLLAGSLVLQVLNMIRFISLFYLGQYSMSWFDFAHGYLWESMLILDTMVLFGLWVGHASKSRRPANAIP